MTRQGQPVWRYAPKYGPGMLDHPSLAIELGNGLIALNDDFRNRVIVIDPRTNKIVWQYASTTAGDGPMVCSSSPTAST